jgi:hypothetical protein
MTQSGNSARTPQVNCAGRGFAIALSAMIFFVGFLPEYLDEVANLLADRLLSL